MSMPYLKAALEAILFMHHKPVPLARMRSIIDEDIEMEEYRSAMQALQEEYASGDRGIEVTEVANGFQFRTKIEHRDLLQRLFQITPVKLSQAALEVLAVVAYKQPCTRDEIDQVRGVDCGQMLRNLMDKKMVKMVGKSDAVGKPMLYGTTREFLELFGLRTLGDLPSLQDIEDMLPKNEVGAEERENAIQEKLSDIVDNAEEVTFNDLELEDEFADPDERYASADDEDSEAGEPEDDFAAGIAAAEEEGADDAEDNLNAEDSGDSSEALQTGAETEAEEDGTDFSAEAEDGDTEASLGDDLTDELSLDENANIISFHQEVTEVTLIEGAGADTDNESIDDRDSGLEAESDLGDPQEESSLGDTIEELQAAEAKLNDEVAQLARLRSALEANEEADDDDEDEYGDEIDFRSLDDNPHMENTDSVGDASISEQLDIHLATKKFDEEFSGPGAYRDEYDEEENETQIGRKTAQADRGDTLDPEARSAIGESHETARPNSSGSEGTETVFEDTNEEEHGEAEKKNPFDH